MNNPFYYRPSVECQKAAKEVADWLGGQPSPFCRHEADEGFRSEIADGKMFGVLCYSTADGTHGYLAAYSGQVCGRSDWPEFVPAVFDYLQPDGFFKQHEAEITAINHQIREREKSIAAPPAEDDTADPKPQVLKGKKDGETDEMYISRRQFENAELHRWKQRERARRMEAETVRLKEKEKTDSLKALRRQKSDSLQRWLFSHFRMRNGRGETQDLLQIAEWYHHSAVLPPAGSGECCEPKLLQYALAHALHPESMAMFWWGKSPKNEVRHHLAFYPACNNKCKPVLQWMLQGIDVDGNPLEDGTGDDRLVSKIKHLYEDDSICVISKPSGLLSVPGKSRRESVLSVMRKRYPNADSPLIVHRLDMDTSGLMVIAKTMEAYHSLQRQFATHAIRKRYVALLESPAHNMDAEGRIQLPLRPDLSDRPRQVVDFEYGRPAVTLYKMVDERHVWLYPQTGRTHQLRVHCAHSLGLGTPILGDNLYGTEKAPRLMLHAEEITFAHPATGQSMTFTDQMTCWQ